MAKLSVVVPSNEVEVEGVKYRKVDREAQAGDIVKALTDRNVDVDKGAFYSVIDEEGATGFHDNVGDFRSAGLRNHPERFEVYEKVTEPAAVEYREVNRKAEKGERIRIVASIDPRYSNGDEFVVEKSELSNVMVYVKHLEGTNNGCAGVLKSEYVVLEPVNNAKPTPQPERLKVGEYVKVTDASGSGYAKKGDIAAVTNDNWLDSRGKLLDVKTLDGRTYGMYAHRFVRATESEVEAAKKAAERAKQIGEFADGGYAVVVDAGKSTCLSGIKNGDYVTVKVDDPNRNVYPLYVCGRNGGYCDADALRKVTREEYGAATKPKPVFSVGDYAKVTCDVMEFRKNDIVRITQDKSCGYISGSFDFKVDRIGKNTYGFISAKNIEKISAEEFARIEEEAKWTAIGRKVGEFKVGDLGRIVRKHGAAANVGDIVEVKSPYNGGESNSVYIDGGWAVGVELIVPVEQRFDKAEGGASPSK
jgi:hypothetical protein